MADQTPPLAGHAPCQRGAASIWHFGTCCRQDHFPRHKQSTLTGQVFSRACRIANSTRPRTRNGITRFDRPSGNTLTRLRNTPKHVHRGTNAHRR